MKQELNDELNSSGNAAQPLCSTTPTESCIDRVIAALTLRSAMTKSSLNW